MNNLISAQEAFVAAQNGKAVLCRYAGNGTLHADKDFSALDQLPATVFFQPHYEFCVKIETMELSGITFAKPLTPHDIQENQEIFIVMPTCILRTKFNTEHSDIQNSVMNGFAQSDAENALLQLKAIGASFGCVIDNVIIKDGFNDIPKNRRNGKSKELVEAKQPIIQTANDDTSIDEIIGPASNQVLPSNDAEHATIKTAQTTASPKTKTLHQEVSDSLKETRDIANSFMNQKAANDVETKPNNGIGQQVEEYHDAQADYEALLKDLLDRASKASTSEEANALVRYTGNWTDQQRKPLLSAISKRLCELQEQQKVQHVEPPSLLVKIQNAKDLTELDALEIDVSSRDPQIQPTLMGYVKKRRFELENADATATSAIDEDLP